MGEQLTQNNNRQNNFRDSLITKIAIGGLLLYGAISLTHKVGDFIDFFNPIDNIADILRDIPAPITSEMSIEVDEPVEIIGIDPILFDCQALITARVPAEGKNEHKILGKTISTDTVTVDAVGDIETCVDGDPTITNTENGSVVVIDAKDITYWRERIDANRTKIDMEGGWLSDSMKALDHFIPFISIWTDENGELTTQGLITAQKFIASSECLEAAYDQTIEVVKQSYVDQGIRNGSPDVQVVIDGRPNFDKYKLTPDDMKIDGFEYKLNSENVTCVVNEGVITTPDTYPENSSEEPLLELPGQQLSKEAFRELLEQEPLLASTGVTRGDEIDV